MRTNILRHVAVALSLTVCTVVQADDYKSPAKWSNFNNEQAQSNSVFKTVGTGCLSCRHGVAGHGHGSTVIPGQVYTQVPGAVYQGGVVHGQAIGQQHGVIQHGGVINQGMNYGAGTGAYGAGAYGAGAYGAGQGTIVDQGVGANFSTGVVGNGGVVSGNAGSTAAGVAAGAAAGAAAGGGSGTRGAASGGGSGSRSDVGGALGQGNFGQSGVVGQGSTLGQGAALNQGFNQGTVLNQGTVVNQVPGAIQGPAVSYNQGIVQSPYANAVQAPWTGSSPVVTQTVTAPQTYYAAPAASYGYSTGYTNTARTVGRTVRSVGRGGSIAPYFGGFNLLFLSLNNNSDRNLLIQDATGNSLLRVDDVSPDENVGFDVHGGRYLSNGLYGLDFGYFLWNPGQEQRIVQAPAGSARATLPQFRDITVDPDGPGGVAPQSVYDYYDGADGFRVRRDLSFQGIEANLFSFGWMGACRTGSRCNQGLGGRGLGHKFHKNSNRRFGGAGGALSRGGNSVQVATSHGFRWFQLEDEFEFAADINAIPDYQPDDLFLNTDVENNLFGYQFGSRLTYSLTNRLLLNVGGKFGIYANNVDARQRIGTQDVLAYITASGADDIDTYDSDTVFSTLGELDLGLGYRVNNAWTVTGGYRLLAVSGVATAPGQIGREFSSLEAAGRVQADDSIILHGGYVGLQYNW